MSCDNESLYDNLTKFLDYRVLTGLAQKEEMSGNALLSGKVWKCLESVWIFKFFKYFCLENVWNFPLVILS